MKDKIYPLKKFQEKHEDKFSIGGLRWMIFNSGGRFDFLRPSIIRIGRRVFIHEEKFFEGIENQGEV